MSGGPDPDPPPDLSSFQIAIETLGLSIAVVQSSFAGLARLRINIRDLLHTGVKIYSYKDHVRLLLPNLPSSMLQSLTKPRCSRRCYEIKWISMSSGFRCQRAITGQRAFPDLLDS